MKKRESNETQKRLDTLHRNHYKWLFSVGFKVSKSKIITEDLIQELYIYLWQRNDTKLFYKDSFNLQYCRSFIHSRFYNLIKLENRYTDISDGYDKEDTPYDEEFDRKIDESYDEVIRELQSMKKQKGWSSAMLAEMYWVNDMTFEELANEISISKSTAFINVRKVKERIKDKIENPFKRQNNEKGKD